MTQAGLSRNLRGLSSNDERSPARTGVMATTGAFLLWGLFPLFWKQLTEVDAVELIAYRIVFSLLFLVPVVVARGTWGSLMKALRTGASVRLHFLSGALLAVNWLVFVWAVNHDRIVETALGYFLTPLLNVAFGMILLKERLRAAQGVAIAIAVVGVGILIVRYGQVPWVSLALAGTFGIYGLLRKKSSLGSLSGLMIETTLLMPLALGYLMWRQIEGVAALGPTGLLTGTLIVSSGIVTAVPLLLFAQGTRLIQLSTVGLLQYIAPSVQFVLGVVVYAEPLPPERLWAFGFIWAALLLYSVDSVMAAHRAGQKMR